MRAIAAAVAMCGFGGAIRHADAQQGFFSVNPVNASDIEVTGPFSSAANAIPAQFFPITGSTASGFPSWGVMDFGGASAQLPANSLVSQVGSDLTVSLWDDNFSSADNANMTLSFFLISDTTTNINVPASSSPLRYLKTTIGQTATFSGGLNGPGLTGGFAANSTYYQIGTGIYNNTLASNPAGTYDFIYSLTLAADAQTFVQQQVNNGGNLRLVVTTNAATTLEASFLSYANTNNMVPSMTLDLTTTPISAGNNSTLFLGTAGTTQTSINFGRVVQGNGVTAVFTLGNSSGTDSAQYRLQSSGMDLASVGSDPLNPGATTTVTVGFSGNNTAYAASADLTGNDTFNNQSNTLSSVTINGTVHPVALRFVDTQSGTLAPAFGKVLSGSTVTMQTSITTTDPVVSLSNGLDFSSNSLTVETLLANKTASPFSVRDPFSNVTLGTIGATSPNFTQTFTNTESGTVVGSVIVRHSGVFGDSDVLTEGGLTKTYATNFVEFQNTTVGVRNVVVGENIVGDNYNSDNIFVYAQWVGYATAALVGTNTPILPGGVGTITNAPPNDNIESSATLTFSFGIRSTGWVTGVGFNQFNNQGGTAGWSQTGLTPVTVSGTGAAAQATTGTTISANNNSLAGVVANTGNTASYTISFVSSASMLSGTYGASMLVQAENEQDISGAQANDLPVVALPVQAVVLTGDGTGSYNLDGGSFTALPVTVLSGSFTQTGGTALFAQLSGGGSLSVSGAQSQLVIGAGGVPGSSFTGPIVNNANLSIQGGTALLPTVVGNISGNGNLSIGTAATAAYLKLNSNSGTHTQSAIVVNAGSTLDISNNTVVVNFGAGPDPIATIASEIGTAFNGGAWTGTSTLAGVITSSTAATGGPVPLSVGYADGNTDSGTPAGVNQALIKYTITGDANLNSTVDFNDLVAVVQNFNKAGDWAHGNFLFGSTINFNDLVVVVQNFNKSANPAGSSGESLGGGGTLGLSGGVHTDVPPVPEPGSLALLGAGAAGLLARRKRGRQRSSG